MALMAPDTYHYLHKDRPAFKCVVKPRTTLSGGELPSSGVTSSTGSDKDASSRLPPISVKPDGRRASFSDREASTAPRHWTQMTSPNAALRQSCSDIPPERRSSGNGSSTSRSRSGTLAEATARYARVGDRLTMSMNGREDCASPSRAVESPIAALRRGDNSSKRIDVGQNQAVAIRESRAALLSMQKVGMPKWEAEAILESEKQRRHQMAVHLLLKQKFTF